MENHKNITLQDINKQLYFDFSLNLGIELTDEEKSLMFLLRDLDYSRFREGRLGRKSKISPCDMATIIVYSYMQGRHSTREIERLTERDMFLRAVLGPIRHIDHTTIDRFITKNTDAIEDLFYQLVNRLGSLDELSKRTVFQDGTKIESRAGRYTFVWKKALAKNIDKTIRRMIGYCREAQEIGLVSAETEIDESSCCMILDGIAGMYDEDDLLLLLSEQPRGRGHRADPIARLLKRITADLAKLKEQEGWLTMIGKGRNSLSKTDIDATFMRMKDDYMRNGQLKPAYNIQNAVDSGYVVGVTVSSDRADYYTCKPTMELLNSRLEWRYENYAADSGYDCNENFRYLKESGVTAFIKPQDWEISRKRSYRNDIGKYQNMKYDEAGDFFICANSRKLKRNGRETYKNGTLYTQYECSWGCKSCKLRKRCIKGQKHDYKKLSLNLEHWNYRKQSYERLISQEGIEMRLNRSIQAEGSFAQMKHNMGLTRFSCFGKKRVLIEWILLAFAFNVSTFSSRLSQRKTGVPQWYSPPAEETA